MKPISILPSIWLGEFNSRAAWLHYYESAALAHSVLSDIDDRLLYSRRPFLVNALCAICESVQSMRVKWSYAGVNSDGSVNPAWTEIAVCCSCGSNSRMRALYSFLTQRISLSTDTKIYMAEQVTPFYSHMKARYHSVIGSEYLDPEIAPGTVVRHKGQLVRHEDLTALSFPTGSFDVIITQDVFEHIADYKAAFVECRRVLAPAGHLVFSIPFFPGQADTIVRAVVSPQGSIEHILPPEYHGNPLGGGSLCFQRFGWNILDSLRDAGFSEAIASLYWGPHQGHFGQYFFIFSATT